jgi:hypothetical protein
MTVHIPTLLEGILDATADEVAAKSRVQGFRAVLEDEARRRVIDEGAAPSWKATAGTVRYQDIGPWTATVIDPQVFASHVADHHPEHVTATVVLDATDLEAALEALEFAGVKPLRSELEVRDPFGTAYLKGLNVDVAEIGQRDSEGHDLHMHREFTITHVDTDTGEAVVVPGTSAARTPGKLVVTLDKDAKAKAVEAAASAASQLVATATVLPTEAAPPADAIARTALIETLVARPAELVTSIAKALDLSQTGTRLELATKVAMMADLNSGAAKVIDAMLAADGPEALASAERGIYPAVMVEPERLDPTDPDLGAKALARADELKAQLQARREHAEAHPEAYTRPAPVEQLLDEGEVIEAQVAAAATPAPAPVAASETPAVVPGDDDPAVLALEAAGNRDQLRKLARANNVAPGGTKRDVALALHAAGHTADEVPTA